MVVESTFVLIDGFGGHIIDDFKTESSDFEAETDGFEADTGGFER